MRSPMQPAIRARAHAVLMPELAAQIVNRGEASPLRDDTYRILRRLQLECRMPESDRVQHPFRGCADLRPEQPRKPVARQAGLSREISDRARRRRVGADRLEHGSDAWIEARCAQGILLCDQENLAKAQEQQLRENALLTL